MLNTQTDFTKKKKEKKKEKKIDIQKSFSHNHPNVWLTISFQKTTGKMGNKSATDEMTF